MDKELSAQSNTKLPEFFRPLFWSVSFDSLDAIRNKKTVIVQTINYGLWRHWQWLAATYGSESILREMNALPETEFRKGAFKLAKLLFHD